MAASAAASFSGLEGPLDSLLLCIMTVDYGDKNTGIVEVRWGDAPSDLAARFVARYGLTEDYLALLIDHITEHKNTAQMRASEALTAAHDQRRAAAAAASAATTAASHTPPASSLNETVGGWSPAPFMALDSSSAASFLAPSSEDAREAQVFAAAQRRSLVAAAAVPPSVRRGSSASAAASSRAARPHARNAPPAPPVHKATDSFFQQLARPKRAPSPPAQVPLLHAHAAPTVPAFWAKLHAEALGKEERRAQLARHLQQLQLDAWKEERRAYRPHSDGVDNKPAKAATSAEAPQGGPPTSPASRVGARLYEAGMLAEARHAAEMEARRSALAAAAAAAWDCPTCGSHNPPGSKFCANPSKSGRLSLSSSAGPGNKQPQTFVCGTPAPSRPFAPALPASSRLKSVHRPAFAPDREAAAYAAELERRAAAAAAAEEAAVAAFPFKPTINGLSEALARRARQGRQAAAAAAAAPRAPRSSSEGRCTFAEEGPLEALRLAYAGEGEEGPQQQPPDAAAAGSPHQQLYQEGLQARRRAAEEQARLQPWHGCTFQPDIGVNAGRPVERSSAAFFSRLHGEAAAARARAAAALARMQEAEEGGSRSNDGSGGSVQSGEEGVCEGGAPPPRATLYARAKETAERHAARIAAEEERIEAEARQGRVGPHSAELLSAMRQRSLAGIFRLLAHSATLSKEARDEELRAQAALEAALGAGAPEEPAAAGAGAPLRSGDLARLIAAVDAHGASAPGAQGPQPLGPAAPLLSQAATAALASAPPDSRGAGVYRAALSASEVAAAASLTLDLDAAWPDILEPMLSGVVTEALDRLRRQQQRAASHEDGGAQQQPRAGSVSFPAFAEALGRVLEELGGGASIYAQAARIRAQQGPKGQGVPPAAAAGGGPAASHAQGAATAAAAGSQRPPVHERLYAISAQQARNAEYKGVAAVRVELRNLNFVPRPQPHITLPAPSAAAPLSGGWFSSAVAAAAMGDEQEAERLRGEHSAELTQRAQRVLRETEALFARQKREQQPTTVLAAPESTAEGRATARPSSVPAPSAAAAASVPLSPVLQFEVEEHDALPPPPPPATSRTSMGQHPGRRSSLGRHPLGEGPAGGREPSPESARYQQFLQHASYIDSYGYTPAAPTGASTAPHRVTFAAGGQGREAVQLTFPGAACETDTQLADLTLAQLTARIDRILSSPIKPGAAPSAPAAAGDSLPSPGL